MRGSLCLLVKMQNRQIPVKGCGELFGQITQCVSHTFSGAKAWHDNEVAYAFMFEPRRLELIFERLDLNRVVGVDGGEQGLDGL